MKRIKFGVALPTCREGTHFPANFSSPQSIVDTARTAEALEYDSVWTNDHILTLSYIRNKKLLSVPPNYYESLTTLSYLAGVTDRVQLGAGVIILPVRNPIVLAKQISTLDVYSGGRLILGVGLGAYKEEFRAVRPGMSGRDRVLLYEEEIRALSKLLSEDTATFDGKYIKFADVEMFPKPIQKPFPIYIGGNSLNGVKRAAELGGGWHPGSLLPNELEERLEIMKEHAKKAHRDFSSIDIAPQFYVSIGKAHDEALKNFRASITYKHIESLMGSTLRDQGMERYEKGEGILLGTSGEVIKQMEEYIKVGVTHFAAMVFVGVQNIQQLLNRMKLFSEEVIPSFR